VFLDQKEKDIVFSVTGVNAEVGPLFLGDMVLDPLGFTFTPIGTRFREGGGIAPRISTEYDAEMDHP
jgi:hypothetical protein